MAIDLSDQTGMGSPGYGSSSDFGSSGGSSFGGSDDNDSGGSSFGGSSSSGGFSSSGSSDRWSDTVFGGGSSSSSSSSGSSSSGGIDLSDQTGNSYTPEFGGSDDRINIDSAGSSSGNNQGMDFTFSVSDKFDNTVFDNKNVSDNELDLMTDYTSNYYDPSNISEQQREQALNIIESRYPGTNKNNFDSIDFSSDYATDEEFFEDTGFQYESEIQKEIRTKEHRFEAPDINQITDEQRGPGISSMEKRGTAYISNRDAVKRQMYANNYSIGGFFSNVFNSVFKGGILTLAKGGDPGLGAASSGLNTAVNYGVGALTDRELSEGYKKNKDKVLDKRFPGVTVEDYAKTPSGPRKITEDHKSVPLNLDSPSDLSNRDSEDSGRWSGTIFGGSNNQQRPEGGQQERPEGGQSSGNDWGSLLTYFLMQDDQEKPQRPQQSSGSSGTTNIITASDEKKDKGGLEKYLPFGIMALIVGSLFILGGE